MIYITRHGQTEWILQKKVMVRCDEPLNENGLNQAEETRKNLIDADIDLIICSPLIRAKQIAEIINKDRNISIIYDDRIIKETINKMIISIINEINKNFFHKYQAYFP